LKIVVIAGGLSPERDVSLSSGSMIANALIQNGHSVCLLDLYEGAHNEYESLFFDEASGKRYYYEVPRHEPDLKRLVEESGNDKSLIGRNVIEICKTADLAFLARHGDIGENGKLQAIFDVFGVRYTGTGYKGSLLAMDKDVSKQLMAASNILTPEWKLEDAQTDRLGADIAAFGYPCVIKPRSCGSSVGVTIVNDSGDLRPAVDYVRKYGKYALIERKITGREFSVGILGCDALPAIEIIPNEGFYDYRNKYQKGLTNEVCPAEIPDEAMARLKDAALRVHKTLCLGDYSRVDFIMDAGGNIYCLEANTLPGMTPTSLLPQEAAAAGISYAELCGRIAGLALARDGCDE